MNLPILETIGLFAVLVGALGLLVLDGAGRGPLHRRQNKGIHLETRGSHETDPFEKQNR